MKILTFLIHVSGQSGCGKSTLSKKFGSEVFRAEMDHVQYEAARRAFPFARKDELMNWYLWPQKPETIHMYSLLSLSLRSVYPALFEAKSRERPVILEGCLLAQNWFRQSLEQILRDAGHVFSDVMHFQLKQTPEVILNRIRARAEKMNCDKQLQIFKDEAAVEHNGKWFSDFLSNDWKTFDDPDLLEAEIRKRLSIADV